MEAPAIPRKHSPGSRRGALWTVTAALVAVPLLPVAPLGAAPAHADTATDGERLTDLREDIDTLLRHSSLEGAVSGVVVSDPDTGEVLYSRDGGERLLPASNMKLFTAAAALEVLGTDHTFSTEVVAERGPGHRRSVEDLYLVGGGDPTLSEGDLDELAAEVAGSGVRVVRGDVHADDTWFDSERLVDDWWPEDEPYAYSAQISALTVAHGERHDTGVTEVSVSPGSAGEPPEVDLGAAEGYAELDNQALTGAPGSGNTLVVDRVLGTNTITVSGAIPADGAPVAVLRTVHEPAGLAGHLFEQALERHGVEVVGGVEFGGAPSDRSGARVLADHESPGLGEILVPFMKFSNNGHAEMLVKSIGRETADEGSWDAGLAGVEKALTGLGVDTSDLVLNDGSGLSRGNLVTADTVVDLLTRSRDASWYGTWRESLPVAGEDDPFVGGTLRYRMGGTAAEGAVSAKTGTMTGVSALSGYVSGPGEDDLVFSIVNNGHSGPAPRGVQDAIAVRLAEYVGHASLAGVRPQSARAEGGGELECSWELTC
ncbi:D-alanyl-D-alanine carboxypeptidase/D-alanyl-D-alanine-endopeptidase (penicillin-binding protein 4) [Nocardiopsis arvandica]|uniref:D-alanyl-D-alanine carboxypeptidase/D-alanyl-D-alanine-endopeptidase (Penicillin-binding protein 4) n=1 Tax=Nocardiopsis sinuspersici TaxID=501010 RepID=A0A7Y9XET0_9ACTN|nr:D-alanyl-D-alanine carboxypeptidase/D-alanyl-D-alanine-endopeptidase (penicillin-binding protein 4) [Nocardiopsis sinuspersici]